MSTMSSVTTATRGLSRQSCTGDLLATLKRWCVAYITWRIERAAIAQLCLMSDRQLKDIGVSRCEIARAVTGGPTVDRASRRYS
jgi:uncharacterized protein YjiS (DUF1127 family)